MNVLSSLPACLGLVWYLLFNAFASSVSKSFTCGEQKTNKDWLFLLPLHFLERMGYWDILLSYEFACGQRPFSCRK
ncbi:unnamed protein product [Linum trigynum]|uniref:Secreted protein n=1 Tax=Linum trigynum TaxID=586398 RepID=A0AAV2ERA3_9ROSI